MELTKPSEKEKSCRELPENLSLNAVDYALLGTMDSFGFLDNKTASTNHDIFNRNPSVSKTETAATKISVPHETPGAETAKPSKVKSVMASFSDESSYPSSADESSQLIIIESPKTKAQSLVPMLSKDAVEEGRDDDGEEEEEENTPLSQMVIKSKLQKKKNQISESEPSSPTAMETDAGRFFLVSELCAKSKISNSYFLIES